MSGDRQCRHVGVVWAVNSYVGLRSSCNVRVLTVCTADETLGIEHCVLRVGCGLILGGLTNQPLVLSEGDIGGRGAVALVVGYDFYTALTEYADAAVGGAEVDADGETLLGSGHAGSGQKEEEVAVDDTVGNKIRLL